MKRWVDKGIIFVKDLQTADKKFYSVYPISRKVSPEDTFHPLFWINKRYTNVLEIRNKTNENSIYPNSRQSQEKKKEMKISTKTVYSFLLKDIAISPPAENKILRPGLTQENIHQIYELRFKLKNGISITMFHYKVIYNILSTKVSLRTRCLPSVFCRKTFFGSYVSTLSFDNRFLEPFSKLVEYKS